MFPTAAVIPVKDVVVLTYTTFFYCRRALNGLAERRSPLPRESHTGQHCLATSNRRCARWRAAEGSISVFLIVFKCGCGLDCHRYSSTSSPFGCVGKHTGVQCVVKSRKLTERKSKCGPDSLHVYTSSHSCGIPSH